MGKFPKYNNKVDIFAMGCILFELASLGGKRAFADDFSLQRYSLSPSTVDFTVRPDHSQCQITLSDTIGGMLERDPQRRPSARSLRPQFIRHRAISIGDICKDRKQYYAAIKAYSAAIELGITDSATELKSLADCYVDVNPEKAVETYVSALRCGFNRPLILGDLAGATLIATGNYPLAIEIYELAVATNPKNNQLSEQLRTTYHDYRRELAAEGRHVEADAYYRKANRKDAGKVSLWDRVGISSMKTDERCITILQKAFVDFTGEMSLAEKLGQIYLVEGDVDSAISIYQSALKKRPSECLKSALEGAEQLKVSLASHKEMASAGWFTGLRGRSQENEDTSNGSIHSDSSSELLPSNGGTLELSRRFQTIFRPSFQQLDITELIKSLSARGFQIGQINKEKSALENYFSFIKDVELGANIERNTVLAAVRGHKPAANRVKEMIFESGTLVVVDVVSGKKDGWVSGYQLLPTWWRTDHTVSEWLADSHMSGKCLWFPISLFCHPLLFKEV
jgi:tetratricopeptide (TPR) repeat protein